ncbi:MAG: DUF1858 domain-containing protein [Bacteroidetes bacterium HGW-Bacteroidetes-9]|jgi:methionine synthase II (cobalamin-independent)|nr:MAG: DUF1858 domain-containing protein [Bacteroidetes bacterium HGW-Bacteroidetes-9]
MNSSDISATTLVADLVSAYPEMVSFLAERKLHCIVCGEPVWGTIGELARDKQFTAEQTEYLIVEIQTAISKRDQ